MDKDLLGNDFTRNIDLGKIDKNLVMIKVVIIIGSLFSIGEIARWLKILLPNLSLYLSPDYFHYILLFVLASIPSAVLFIMSWFLYFIGTRLMKLSIENSDPVIFNKAYTCINRSSLMSIVGSCISLVSTIVFLLLE